MKLVTYSFQTIAGKHTRIGALVDEQIIDLTLGYTCLLSETGKTGRAYEIAAELIPPDMLEFLRGGELSRNAADEVITFVGDRLKRKQSLEGPQGEKIIYAMDEVSLRAPVLRPNTVRDAMSFEGHMRNFEKRTGKPSPPVWFKRPAYHKGNPCTVIGPDEPILWPDYTQKLDYELEFGLYIGKEGKNISADKAQEYIAGYTAFNDISARDVLTEDVSTFLGPGKGKDFNTGYVMGPCMVTADELDIEDLKLEARINGETWSKGRTSDMYWKFPHIVEWISRSETLFPGDFIGSGTPENGCGDELDRWIQPGDTIEIEVEGIGVLRNTVIKPDSPTQW